MTDTTATCGLCGEPMPEMAGENARLMEALKPFAQMALRFGKVYLDERQKELGDNPYNLPHNYSTAVMKAAENTSWADWCRALEAYEGNLSPAPASPVGEDVGEDVVEKVARAILPEWFTEDGSPPLLNNYPDQHLRYQETAREKARAALAAIGRT